VALTKCEECGLMVSSEAKTCPHCGAKLRISDWHQLTAWHVLGFVVLLSLLVYLGSSLVSDYNTPSISEIATKSEEYAKELFEGTDIVYKKIAGVKKSKGDYIVAVVVDIPDYNDRVLILEIERIFKDQYTVGWDARSATFLSLLKAGQELEQTIP